MCFVKYYKICYSGTVELSDDDGDVERLQLLESGSSDVSFRSLDVSSLTVLYCMFVFKGPVQRQFSG